MKDKSANLAKIMRAVTACLEASPDEDIEALLAGKAKLRIDVAGPKRESRKPRPDATFNANEIATKLRSLPGRREGFAYLDELALTRKELEALAREMKQPISKQDNAERLREKLVESAIGSRLASEAVRGPS
ncbi:MAG TPA: hypothetical protein VHE55_05275 [Fimbriimonadaceae bacterium]|nr:hypothetical protein [Fimbriimonadaceae bacterium]